MAASKVWQFRVLCFGPTTAPQVFTRVMALVSAFLHRLGIHVLRYLDYWLILAASREEAIWTRDNVLELCEDLGIVVNLEKSSLVPSQIVSYLGVRINSQTFQASPTPTRIEKFFSIVEEFLSSRRQSASFWRVLLGHLASLIHLVPSGRLCVRSLQLCLRDQWDFLDESQVILWDASSQEDLLWWCEEGRLEEGISLESRLPNLMFWSDASNQGWGATACDHVVSGRWESDEVDLSISVRELLAIEKGLHSFLPFLKGQSVAEFSDNTTALSYLHHQGGTLSKQLNHVAQRLLHWAESHELVLHPQFVMGCRNVVADSLLRPNQIVGSEWMLHHQVFASLQKRWSVTVDLFATSLNHRLPVYFAPMSDPMAAGTDTMLQNWDHLEAYAFPPVTMLHQVLNKIRNSVGTHVTLIALLWLSKEWFPALLSLLTGPPVPLPQWWNLLRQPHVRKFHQRLSWLRLHAWRLCSDLPEPPDSLLVWLDNLAA